MLERMRDLGRRTVAARIHWLRGWLLHWQGDARGSVAAFHDAAEAAPRSFALRLALAVALLRLGRLNEARGALVTCYRLDRQRFLAAELPPRCRERVVLECELPALVEPAPRSVARPASAVASRGLDGDRRPGPGAHSDFVDEAETRRFRDLKPLREVDHGEFDWNDVLQKFGTQPGGEDASEPPGGS